VDRVGVHEPLHEALQESVKLDHVAVGDRVPRVTEGVLQVGWLSVRVQV